MHIALRLSNQSIYCHHIILHLLRKRQMLPYNVLNIMQAAVIMVVAVIMAMSVLIIVAVLITVMMVMALLLRSIHLRSHMCSCYTTFHRWFHLKYNTRNPHLIKLI